MGWEKDGVSYWENPECPRSYLEESLKCLISEVEDVIVPIGEFKELSEEELRSKVDFYEYVSGK